MEEERLEEALREFYRCDELSRSLPKEEYSGFMVLANLRMGMVYDLQGKRELALRQYEKVLDMKDHSKAHEQAERYRKTAYHHS
jgi:tetratricopeptide (TPR) repeat protein